MPSSKKIPAASKSTKQLKGPKAGAPSKSNLKSKGGGGSNNNIKGNTSSENKQNLRKAASKQTLTDSGANKSNALAQTDNRGIRQRSQQTLKSGSSKTSDQLPQIFLLPQPARCMAPRPQLCSYPRPCNCSCKGSNSINKIACRRTAGTYNGQEDDQMCSPKKPAQCKTVCPPCTMLKQVTDPNLCKQLACQNSCMKGRLAYEGFCKGKLSKMMFSEEDDNKNKLQSSRSGTSKDACVNTSAMTEIIKAPEDAYVVNPVTTSRSWYQGERTGPSTQQSNFFQPPQPPGQFPMQPPMAANLPPSMQSGMQLPMPPGMMGRGMRMGPGMAMGGPQGMFPMGMPPGLMPGMNPGMGMNGMSMPPNVAMGMNPQMGMMPMGMNPNTMANLGMSGVPTGMGMGCMGRRNDASWFREWDRRGTLDDGRKSRLLSEGQNRNNWDPRQDNNNETCSKWKNVCNARRDVCNDSEKMCSLGITNEQCQSWKEACLDMRKVCIQQSPNQPGDPENSKMMRNPSENPLAFDSERLNLRKSTIPKLEESAKMYPPITSPELENPPRQASKTEEDQFRKSREFNQATPNNEYTRPIAPKSDEQALRKPEEDKLIRQAADRVENPDSAKTATRSG